MIAVCHNYDGRETFDQLKWMFSTRILLMKLKAYFCFKFFSMVWMNWRSDNQTVNRMDGLTIGKETDSQKTAYNEQPFICVLMTYCTGQDILIDTVHIYSTHPALFPPPWLEEITNKKPEYMKHLNFVHFKLSDYEHDCNFIYTSRLFYRNLPFGGISPLPITAVYTESSVKVIALLTLFMIPVSSEKIMVHMSYFAVTIKQYYAKTSSINFRQICPDHWLVQYLTHDIPNNVFTKEVGELGQWTHLHPRKYHHTTLAKLKQNLHSSNSMIINK